MEELTPSDSDTTLSDYFRDADFSSESVLAWRIDQHGGLVDALRGLFHGPAGLVRLRLFVFMGLLGQSEANLNRDQINELFHAVRPEALDTVFKRFRDTGLLLWDETQRRTSLTPLAQQLSGVLGIFHTAPLGADGDGDLASLLSQVVGADQLGTLDAAQVQMLQAQLGRLHAEFEDAIASGSEFRLREARTRYDRAARLIDKASTAIATIIGNAHGHVAMERAARALGQAQSRLLAMASQFNRALQQVDRQRVTLGTTGITSTDVKRWLQTLAAPEHLLQDALAHPVVPVMLSPHELLDVTEAEFERDRPTLGLPDALPLSQAAPLGELSAVALPQALADLSDLLAAWHASEPVPRRAVDALLGDIPVDAEYAHVAYKAQLLPLLGDAQACQLPGATGDLARQPWRVEWSTDFLTLDHPTLAGVSAGQLHPVESTEKSE
ncbi:hypothetical protein [Rhodoferax sp.]|uniref:hypothetical protein n=1 Tax=Rhodoferax sp. TaxID=50421 RepID=UPI0025CD990E|nr:hypothetical protein [Rhodoferax sp.]